MPVSSRPWSSFSAADYTPAQYHRACLVHLHQGPVEAKDDCKLPVREPSGALNRGGVHAAAAVLAGGRGGVAAPPEAKRRAARSLLSLYREIGDPPPDSLRRLAG